MNKEEKIKELLAEIKALKEETTKYKEQKAYGLVWENEKNKEKIVEDCKKKLPILERVKDKEIITDKTQPMNLMIEGDNYHALTCLNYTHRGKIDVIYIDPPYNTGAKDWKYNNDYVDGEDRFRHSKWLNMMEKRLILAKELLTESGFICIAIDHNEFFNLGYLCDNIFGEKNRLGIITLIIKEGGRNLAKFFGVSNEFCFVYTKNKNMVNFNSVIIDSQTQESFKFKDEKGFYALKKFIRDFDPTRTRYTRPKQWYPIYISKDLQKITTDKKEGYHEIFPISSTNREMVWETQTKNFISLVKDGEIIAEEVNNKINILKKKRLNQVFKTHWFGSKYDAVAHGTKLVNSIIGKDKFNYPKSLYTVIDFLKITSKKDSIILDFFAGSGTTGHAVMELNKEDGGDRQFILCTNNENNNGNGQGGIAEAVCYPRIQKVIEGYKKNGDGEWVAGLGGNLHYFKADENSFISIEMLKNISDEKRLELTLKAGELIVIRENIFDEKEHSKYYQIFEDDSKQVAIYFKEEHTKLNELVEKLDNTKEKIVYLFSWGKNLLTGDDLGYPDITVKDIPEPIIRIYQEING